MNKSKFLFFLSVLISLCKISHTQNFMKSNNIITTEIQENTNFFIASSYSENSLSPLMSNFHGGNRVL